LANSETAHRKSAAALEIQTAVREESWRPGRLNPNLSWTHYRSLLRVGRANARTFYETPPPPAAKTGSTRTPGSPPAARPRVHVDFRWSQRALDVGERPLDPAVVAVVGDQFDAKFQMRVEGDEAAALRGFDGVNFERDFQPNTHGAENRGEVVHARISSRRQHPMQALARRFGLLRELLESDGGVDEVAQNEAGGFRITAQKQRCRFIEKRLGKSGIALNALEHGLPRVSSQLHLGEVLRPRLLPY
jgi:hypothetical protein